jgi:hypothetical protein
MWYILRNNQPTPPVSLEDMRVLVAKGELRSADLVCPVGGQSWMPASTVDGLFAGVPELVTPVLGPPTLPPTPPPFPTPAGPNPRASSGWAVWMHLRRAYAGNLHDLSVSDGEREFLKNRNTEVLALQRYLAWRRSVLFVLCLLALLSAVLGIIDQLSSREDVIYNAFGKFMLAIETFSFLAMPVAAVIAALTWHRSDFSFRVLAAGWLITFLGPILMALVPVTWMIDFSRLGGGRLQHGAEVTVKFIFGLAAFGFLAVYLAICGVSIAQGIIPACLRLKTLVPASGIPGLFIVVSAPILPLALLPFFVLAMQLAASPLLLLGLLLVSASSLIYVFRAGLFIRPWVSRDDFRQMVFVQWLSSGLLWLGVALLVIYALTREFALISISGGALKTLHLTLLGFTTEGSFYRPWDWKLLRWLLIETTSRSLFTTILIADLFMRVTTSMWYYSNRYAAGKPDEEYEELMADQAKRRFGA